MNFWKKSLFRRALGAGAGESTGPKAGALGPRVGSLMASLPQRTGGIIERQGQSEERKTESDFFSLQNGLAVLL